MKKLVALSLFSSVAVVASPDNPAEPGSTAASPSLQAAQARCTRTLSDRQVSSSSQLLASTPSGARQQIQRRYRSIAGEALQAEDLRSADRARMTSPRYRRILRAIRETANEIIAAGEGADRDQLTWANQVRPATWPLSRFHSCVYTTRTGRGGASGAGSAAASIVLDSDAPPQGVAELASAAGYCESVVESPPTNDAFASSLVGLYQRLMLDYCGAGIVAERRREEYRTRAREAGGPVMERPIPMCAPGSGDPGRDDTMRTFRLSSGRTVLFRDRPAGRPEGAPEVAGHRLYWGPLRVATRGEDGSPASFTPSSSPRQLFFYRERTAIRRLLSGELFPPDAQVRDRQGRMVNCRQLATRDDWHVVQGRERSLYATCLDQVNPQAYENLQTLTNEIAENSGGTFMGIEGEAMAFRLRRESERCQVVTERLRAYCETTSPGAPSVPTDTSARLLLEQLNSIQSAGELGGGSIEAADPEATVARYCQNARSLAATDERGGDSPIAADEGPDSTGDVDPSN
jgi:hypothetical protein